MALPESSLPRIELQTLPAEFLDQCNYPAFTSFEANFTKLERKECFKSYAKPYLSDHRNLILVVQEGTNISSYSDYSRDPTFLGTDLQLIPGALNETPVADLGCLFNSHLYYGG